MFIADPKPVLQIQNLTEITNQEITNLETTLDWLEEGVGRRFNETYIDILLRGKTFYINNIELINQGLELEINLWGILKNCLTQLICGLGICLFVSALQVWFCFPLACKLNELWDLQSFIFVKLVNFGLNLVFKSLRELCKNDDFNIF